MSQRTTVTCGVPNNKSRSTLVGLQTACIYPQYIWQTWLPVSPHPSTLTISRKFHIFLLVSQLCNSTPDVRTETTKRGKKSRRRIIKRRREEKSGIIRTPNTRATRESSWAVSFLQVASVPAYSGLLKSDENPWLFAAPTHQIGREHGGARW